MLETRLQDKRLSVYQCGKQSGIPYTTVLELVRGKTRLEKCSAETVYKLSRVLGVAMEELIEDVTEPRLRFETFKGNVCHRIKDLGDLPFIVETLQKDEITRFWNKRWYPEAFYLLAALDYLSRVNDLPLCRKYDPIRTQKLQKTLYPRDVELARKLSPDLDIREKSRRESIPEFMRFNIVERGIRDVF